ncbi:MAG: thermonuclease family protein [Proteobacteria bacterium]|nr:thermonuclease family protein [Pseudomonadota bacterium]
MIFFWFMLSAMAESCPHGSDRFNCVQFVRAIDGDTIVIDIPGVHSYFGSKAEVRLYGVDTPEKKGGDCEVKLSRLATKLVESELKSAKRIDVQLIANSKGKMRREKFGRILAKISYEGKSLSEVLLKNNLAVEYHGEKKKKIDWCGLGKKYLK